jgi:hypothetical protein
LVRINRISWIRTAKVQGANTATEQKIHGRDRLLEHSYPGHVVCLESTRNRGRFVA